MLSSLSLFLCKPIFKASPQKQGLVSLLVPRFLLKTSTNIVLGSSRARDNTTNLFKEQFRAFSSSRVKYEQERAANPFEQNLLQGIRSFLKDTQDCFASGDAIQTQKRYEQMYNTLNKSSLVSSPDVQNIIDDLIKASVAHITQIEKAFQKKKENIIFPLYKLYWKAATVLQAIGDVEKALKLISNSLDIVPKDNSEELPQIKIVKASILNSMGLHDQAFELHTKAITEIGPKVTWKNGSEAAIAFHELGEYYLGVKVETAKAIQSFEKALSICEGFYGWTTPQTTKTAIILSRLYLETNKVDFSIILGEKALVGIELFLDSYEAPFITITGAYLARAYERKGFLPFQQSTITKVYNILRRKKAETDSQTYMECVFKLENMMGSCRYLQGHLKLADQTFSKLDQLAESVMPEWLKKDPEEAKFELAYMKYFKGVSKIGLKETSEGVKELEQAKAIFLNIERHDWANHCEEYINNKSK
nr:unnamed protein product [Naegleria fowleri]